jgi:hypothetical protein
VYRARDLALEQTVALKVLHPSTRMTAIRSSMKQGQTPRCCRSGNTYRVVLSALAGAIGRVRARDGG